MPEVTASLLPMEFRPGTVSVANTSGDSSVTQDRTREQGNRWELRTDRRRDADGRFAAPILVAYRRRQRARWPETDALIAVMPVPKPARARDKTTG
jgi:hypothetical protein